MSDTRREFLVPLVVLVSAIAVASIITAVNGLLLGRGGLLPALAVVAGAGLTTFGALRADRRITWLGCLVFGGAGMLTLLLPLRTGAAQVTWSIFHAVTSFPGVLLIAAATVLRRPWLEGERGAAQLLAVVGVALAAGGALGLANSVMALGFDSLLSNWVWPLNHALKFAVGLGLVYRDRLFGCYGTFVLVLLVPVKMVWGHMVVESTTDWILMAAAWVIFPAALAALAVFAWRDRFENRAGPAFAAWTEAPSGGGGGGGGGYSQSKSCGRCGRSVPTSAMAGNSCPHCGAHWAGEQTIVR